MRIVAGLDLGSKSVSYFVMNQSGKRLGRGKLSWKREKWQEWVEKWGTEDLEVAFETGPEGYRAEWLLKELGVKTHPFHAGHFGEVSRNRKKTDRLDAERIGRALRAEGLPRRVTLPDPEAAQVRNLVTERELDLKMLRQIQNRVRCLGRQWGVELPAYSKMTPERWWEEAEAAFPPGEIQVSVGRMHRQALVLLQNLEELEEATRRQSVKAGHQQAVENMDSVPGVGGVIAHGAAAYLQDGSRFRNGRQFASYIGITPSVEQTGVGRPKLGRITREGPPVLRRLFVQAAHAAVRGHQLKKTRWYRWFQELKERRGYRKAIVALARKIAMVCYAIVRDGKKWDPGMLWK